MKHSLIFLFTFVFGLIFSFQSKSQTDSVDVYDLSLQELMNIPIVVGSNIKGLTLRETPASVYAITKEDIKLSGARHLGELLQIYVPGFMWVTDEDDYIFGFRGLIQDNNALVALLVNGQNVSYEHSMGMGSMAGLLDLNHIERVEVLTGPGSAELGTGPLTGVINIVTEDFSKETGETLLVKQSLGSGVYNTTYVGYKDYNGPLKFSVSLSTFSQKNGFEPLDGNEKWIIPPGVKNDNKYFESLRGYSMFADATYNEWRLSTYFTKSQNDPYTVSSKAYQIYDVMGGILEKSFPLGENLELSTSSRIKAIGFFERFHPDEPGNVAQTGQFTLTEQLALQYSIDKLKVSAGGDLDFYQFGKNPFTGRNEYQLQGFDLANQDLSVILPVADVPQYIQYNPDFNVISLGLFAEAYYHINETHSLLASLRYSYIDMFEQGNISPRIAYLGNYNNFSWKLFYTKAFRTPVYGSNADIPVGGWWRHYYNPDIETQSIDDIEFNLNYHSDKFSIELRSFFAYNKKIIQGGGTNLLTNKQDDPLVKYFWWTYLNSGDIKSTGAEINLMYKPADFLSIRLSHSTVKVIDTDLNVDADLFVSTAKNKFLNFPEDVTRLHVTYKPFKKLWLKTDMLYDYGRYKGDPLFLVSENISNIKSDNWFNINVGVLFKPHKNWEINGHVYNLLNDRPYWPVVFQNQFAVPAPPLSFTVGLAYNLDF